MTPFRIFVLTLALGPSLWVPATAQVRPVESTYVPQYVPLPVDAIRDAAQAIQRRADQNAEHLGHLLQWLYETKPSVSDPVLLEDLNDYQSILEHMQQGALSDAAPTLRQIESGIQKALSNAEIRLRGGQPDNNLPLLGDLRYTRRLVAARSALAAEAIVMREDFNDNSRSWQVEQARGERVSMVGGNYVMEISDSRGWHYFSIPAPRLTRASEFIVEANVRRTSSNRSRFPMFGLIWGMHDNQNYNAFVIDPDQRSFTVISSVSGNTFTLVEGRYVDAIRSGSAENLLSVTRLEGRYAFSINGSIVGYASATSLPGDQVGFYVGPRQTILASSIAVAARP